VLDNLPKKVGSSVRVVILRMEVGEGIAR